MSAYDKTGKNPNNKITGEIHTLIAGDHHIIIPTEGVFYVDEMTVFSISTGQPVAWAPYYFDTDVFALTGKPVAVGVGITDLQSAGDFSLSYQFVGGPMAFSTRAAIELKKAIEVATTGPIPWSRVKHPATFRGAEHGHVLTDLTELERISDAIEDLTRALRYSGTLSISGNELSVSIQRIASLIGQLRTDLNQVGGGALAGLTTAQHQEYMDAIETIGNEFISLSETQISQQTALSELRAQFDQFINALSTDATTNVDTMSPINAD